ncbi:unnamed protein product [Agarophyton chilense]
MVRGGASQDFWNKIVNTSFNRDNCKWDRRSVGTTVSDLEEGFRYLSERKVDYFYSLRGSVIVRASINCEEYVPVGAPFFSTSVAFVLPRDTNVTILRHLDNTTRFLREEDPFPTADDLARANSCGDSVEATITVEKLAAFSIMYVGAWLFLVVYRCAFLWRRRKRQRYEQQEQQEQLFEPKYPDHAHVSISDLSKVGSVDPDKRDEEEFSSEPNSGSLMNIEGHTHFHAG